MSTMPRSGGISNSGNNNQNSAVAIGPGANARNEVSHDDPGLLPEIARLRTELNRLLEEAEAGRRDLPDPETLEDATLDAESLERLVQEPEPRWKNITRLISRLTVSLAGVKDVADSLVKLAQLAGLH